MKLFLCSVLLGLVSFGALADGLVLFNNTHATLVLNQSGPISGPSGSWYFGLFTADPQVTSVSLSDLVSPLWTFTGVYATNFHIDGTFVGGVTLVPTGWEPGETRSFAVAGWSSNLGHDWADIADQIGSGQYLAFGEIGISQRGIAMAGGYVTPGDPPLPAARLFGTDTSAGLIPGFTLQPVPEPGSCTLALLGLTSFLARRRTLRRH